MRLGTVLLFLVSITAAFFAGWSLGRSHAPVIERPAPQRAPEASAQAAPTSAGVEATKVSSTTAPELAPGPSPAPTAPDPQIVAPTDGPALVDAVRAAWARGDKGAAAILGEELKKWIGDDPSRALEVVAMMDDETNAELLDGMFRFLGEKFLKDPRVRAKVLEIATSHRDPAHQAKALGFLRRVVEDDPAYADSVPQATVHQVLALLRNSPSEDVRAQSARLLGKFVARPGVWDAMKEVALNFRDEGTGAREAAIEALRSGEDPSALGVLVDILKQDPDEKLRKKAAESLAVLAPTRQKEEVFREVEGLLGTERNWDVKGMLIFSLIRVSPDDSVGALQRAASRESDPKARARIEAVSSVLADGERDWLKIFMKSQERIKRLEVQEKQ